MRLVQYDICIDKYLLQANPGHPLRFLAIRHRERYSLTCERSKQPSFTVALIVGQELARVFYVDHWVVLMDQHLYGDLASVADWEKARCLMLVPVQKGVRLFMGKEVWCWRYLIILPNRVNMKWLHDLVNIIFGYKRSINHPRCIFANDTFAQIHIILTNTFILYILTNVYSCSHPRWYLSWILLTPDNFLVTAVISIRVKKIAVLGHKMNILFFLQKEGHRVAPPVRETVYRMNLRYLHIVIDHSESPFVCFTKQTAGIALSKRLVIDLLPLRFLVGSTHEKGNA